MIFLPTDFFLWLLVKLQVAFLNHQLDLRKRRLTLFQKLVLRLVAYLVPFWKCHLFVIKPAAVLAVYKQMFKVLWKQVSGPHGQARRKRIPEEVQQLIRHMARHNFWGPLRILNELARLGIKVAKRTVEKYMRQVDRPSFPGGEWKTFLTNHQDSIIQTDFTTVHPLFAFFWPVQLLFFISIKTRKIVHWNLTTNPGKDWVKQQFKEASPYHDSRNPLIFVHDRDTKFQVDLESVGIKHIVTAYRSPNMNAFIERFMKTLKKECLSHFVFYKELDLVRTVSEFVKYYNHLRTHQGIEGKIPELIPVVGRNEYKNIPGTTVLVKPILGGLHHHYIKAA